MFTEKMENVIDQRMQILSNIQAETKHRVIDQMTKDNNCFKEGWRTSLERYEEQ